jgi:magnesium-transporting ATPase (P-type)
MPVVTTTVLAIGAQEMAREKAIVSRQASTEASSVIATQIQTRPAPSLRAERLRQGTIMLGSPPDIHLCAHGIEGARSDCCRLSALEELSGVEVLASDKTGTLTLNQ